MKKYKATKNFNGTKGMVLKGQVFKPTDSQIRAGLAVEVVEEAKKETKKGK